MDGSAARVLANWDAIKKAEKKADAGQGSLLDGVQRAQPALAEAAKLGSKATKVGFDWSDWRDLLTKVEEEARELVEAVEHRAMVEAGEKQVPFGNDNQNGTDSSVEDAVESELGDLLFTVVNLGRHLHVDAEMALRGTNARFRRRFAAMERMSERPLGELEAAELEALWVRAKMQLAEKGEMGR